MDLFAPARAAVGLGFGVATTGFRLASAAPRIAAGLLGLTNNDSSADDGARFSNPPGASRPEPPAGAGTATATAPRRPARRTPPRRAGTPATTKAPAEPTSAAGASGGVAGTMDAPGAAATAGAPDPTAASSTRRQRPAPGGERRAVDVAPEPKPARHLPEMTKGEVGRIREQEREDEANADERAAASAGSAAPGPTLRVDAPWEGYDKMRAPDIVTRLSAADDTVKAIVRLYEGTHKNRRSILDATGG
jgi:hypothetical protein